MSLVVGFASDEIGFLVADTLINLRLATITILANPIWKDFTG